MAIDVNTQEQTIYRGETAVIPFAPETATSISGWTLAASLSTKPGAAVIATITPAVVSAAAGTFTVTLTSAVTAALTTGSTVYLDVWRTDSGAEERLAGVAFRVKEPVRRPA